MNSATRCSHCMYASHHCLDEAPGEIGVEVELGGVEPDGTASVSGWVSVSSALGKDLFGVLFHLTSPVLAPYGPVWHPEHLDDLHLLGQYEEFMNLQLVVQAQHSVPMRLSLDDQFFPLPLRRNLSFTVLLARLDHDAQGLSCLLPQPCYDNPACAKPGWEYSLRDSFLHFAQPGV